MEKILKAILMVIYGLSFEEASIKRGGVADWGINYKNGPDIINFSFTFSDPPTVEGYVDLTARCLRLKGNHTRMDLNDEHEKYLRGVD
jgi:hypothetical protein